MKPLVKIQSKRRYSSKSLRLIVITSRPNTKTKKKIQEHFQCEASAQRPLRVVDWKLPVKTRIMNSAEYDELAVNFERVLNGLLQQNYNVTSDVYFDMFIKHLSSKNAYGIGEADLMLF